MAAVECFEHVEEVAARAFEAQFEKGLFVVGCDHAGNWFGVVAASVSQGRLRVQRDWACPGLIPVNRSPGDNRENGAAHPVYMSVVLAKAKSMTFSRSGVWMKNAAWAHKGFGCDATWLNTSMVGKVIRIARPIIIHDLNTCESVSFRRSALGAA